MGIFHQSKTVLPTQKFGQGIEKKSARIIQMTPSIFLYPSKPILSWPLQMNLFCFIQWILANCGILKVYKQLAFMFDTCFYRNDQLGIVFGCSYRNFTKFIGHLVNLPKAAAKTEKNWGKITEMSWMSVISIW